jgi:hypothetical protein
MLGREREKTAVYVPIFSFSGSFNYNARRFQKISKLFALFSRKFSFLDNYKITCYFTCHAIAAITRYITHAFLPIERLAVH